MSGDPVRMSVKPARDGIDQGCLIVACRPVTVNPVLAKIPEGGTDVLMFELYRAFGSILQEWRQRASMFGLVAVPSGELLFQHREVIGDDQVIFVICPWLARHFTKLSVIGKDVISPCPGFAARTPMRALSRRAVAFGIVRFSPDHRSGGSPGPGVAENPL